MIQYNIFVKRIGLVGVTNILVALSSFILLPILTKNLSIQEYGVWAQIMVTVGLIPSIATLGMPYTMVRFLASVDNQEEICEEFYTIAFFVGLVSLISSILFLLFSNEIANLLFNGLTDISILLSLTLFIVCIDNLLINYFRTFQQMKRYSFFLFAKTYLNVVLASFFVISGYGIQGALIGYTISQGVILLVTFLTIYMEIGIKFPQFIKIKEYLVFGLPTIPGNLSYWAVDSSDRYLIGIFLGVSSVAYYSPSYTLGNTIMMLLTPFSILLPSVLAKSYDANHREEVKDYLNYSLKYFLAIAIPCVFGLSLLSKPILLLLTTEEIALNGYFITPFVAAGGLLFGIYGIISNILILKNKTKIIGAIWIIAALLNISLNIIFIPYFGIIGAASVTLFSYAIALTISLFISYKYIKFSLDLPFILKSILASTIMSLIIIYYYPKGIMNILLIIIVCALAYFLIIYSLKGIKKEELKFFKNLIFN